MSNTLQYDYVIIGGGLAGLQLAMALGEDTFFKDTTIAIIEPQKKEKQDCSWSFWEKEIDSKWEPIIHHKWQRAIVEGSEERLVLDMNPYTYKSIRSEDFYKYAMQKIENCSNLHWITDTIVSVKDKLCHGEKATYRGEIIFDSRIIDQFKQQGIYIQQHFKGWLIESEQANFDPSSFTMMDFSLSYKNYCCFTYLLPYSKTKALVECTFFSPNLVEEEIYDSLLKQYLFERLNLTHYHILEQEQGNIPMSSYRFESENTSNYLKIGTAGGWVKASSGYSFKNTERKVQQVIKNIKHQKQLDYGLFKKRFKFYDRILLRILNDENHLGNKIFKEMYARNSIPQLFKFLDEKTTFIEELKIINTFSKAPFLRSLRKEIQ